MMNENFIDNVASFIKNKDLASVNSDATLKIYLLNENSEPSKEYDEMKTKMNP